MHLFGQASFALVREWLEQQTVIGTLQVDDANAGPAERRYRLPAGHAEVLVDRDSPNYLAPAYPKVRVDGYDARCAVGCYGASRRREGRDVRQLWGS